MFITDYKELLLAIDSTGDVKSPVSCQSMTSKNRVYQTKEIYNVQIFLNDFKTYLFPNEVEYLKEEFDWFLNEKYFNKDSNIHPKSWEDKRLELKELSKTLLNCTNRDGVNSNYGYLCLHKKNRFNLTQLDWIVNRLSNDRESRQAVAFYNSPDFQHLDNDDFVCTLSQQFYIDSKNRLNTVINSRSNDIINCFRFDSIWFRMFQIIVMNYLNRNKSIPPVTLGNIFCNIFSAHYYMKDQELYNILVNKDEFIDFNIQDFLNKYGYNS